MSIANILFYLVISPLESIIEIFYLLFYRVTNDPAIAVLGIGFAVNILALPLYARAEQWQELEREIQKRLKPKLDQIKAVFKGDERMMIISTYYRQNGYHPIYALRSSFGLLLQIPFFIAAYAFIVKIPELRGSSFWIFRDLSAPDRLVTLGSLNLNFLPILMTLINIAASVVYTRGLAAREKVQLYAMAFVFLVLLYDSPAALVMYWTFNNVFSLLKNIVFKAKAPLKVFYLIMSALAIGAIVFALLDKGIILRKRIFIDAFSALILVSPLLVALGKRIAKRYILPAFSNEKDRRTIFFLSIATLAILVGATVPTSLISSSTQEFSFVGKQDNPFGFVLFVSVQSAGFFVFWPIVLYYLFGSDAKAILASISATIIPIALLDVFAFGGDYGTISRQLALVDAARLNPGLILSLANIATIMAGAGIVLAAFGKKKTNAMISLLSICALSVASLSTINAITIAKDYAKYKDIRSSEAMPSMPTASGSDLEPVFRLSKSGKNVFVIMLDRGISAFVPYLMREDPGLLKEYRGFVWYPNTVSHGGYTLVGAPSIFGGYEYSPEEMNKRSDETLRDKYNEALTVLPRLFSESGWESTVTDAPWANFSWIPDNNIFKPYSGIRAFNLEGRYSQRWLADHGMESDPREKISQNLIRFGFFKIAPMALRGSIYNDGKWWDSTYESMPELSAFLDKYAPLDYLPELVSYEGGRNTFSIMTNNTAHDPTRLSYLEKNASLNIQGSRRDFFGEKQTDASYQVNLAAFKLIGRFLDALRVNEAYDNTRIIIVSDHGFSLQLPDLKQFGQRASTISNFNALLMVKDFGSTEPFSEDHRFGTNADTPAIATAGLGFSANPFTGKPFRTLRRGESVQITGDAEWDAAKQDKYRLNDDRSFQYIVRDDYFSPTNWSFPR